MEFLAHLDAQPYTAILSVALGLVVVVVAIAMGLFNWGNKMPVDGKVRDEAPGRLGPSRIS
jgi:hypothetical protein